MRNKKFTVAAILTGICLALVGCGRFDAGAYTQAVLDASYKNQTENYIELTGVEKEKAEAIFQTNLDATMEEFKSEKLSDELEQNYRTLFETIIQQVKYTVGKAEKKEEGYTVEVMVEPITLFDDTYQTFQTQAEAYAKGITDSVMNGAALPTDQEIQEEVYRLYYEILKAEAEAGVKYGKSQAVTLHIVKTEEGEYEISREDLKILDGKLISRKVMPQEEKK